MAAFTVRTKDLVSSFLLTAASLLLGSDWDTATPFMGYPILTSGAHITPQSLGFSSPHRCPTFPDGLQMSVTIRGRPLECVSGWQRGNVGVEVRP